MPQGVSDNPPADDQNYMYWVYEKFSRLMFSTALKYVSDKSAAEDLIQDVIIKLITKISTLRKLSRCALSSYIVISVRNASINYLRQQESGRKHMVEEAFDELYSDIRDTSVSPEDMVLFSERKNAFYMVWEMLLEKDRDLLMGKYVLELSDKELAEMCGCKTDSVRMLLTRARRRALAIMKEESFGYDET